MFGMELINGWSLRLHGSDDVVLEEDTDLYFAALPFNLYAVPEPIFTAYQNKLLELGCSVDEDDDTVCDCSAVEDHDAFYPPLNLRFYTNAQPTDGMAEVVQVTVPPSAFINSADLEGMCSLSLGIDENMFLYSNSLFPVEFLAWYDMNLDATGD